MKHAARRAMPAPRTGGNPPYRWLHALTVVALLAVSVALAVTSLVHDSVTFDETSHLTAGMSYLKTGDFRLAPDHPPLGKIWCAWPLLLIEPDWPDADQPDWVDANIFHFARAWLFERNDGQRFVVIGRCLMVMVLAATGLMTYALGREIFGPRAGLCALALAALCPTMLAHGRLVTTDMPITFCLTLTLWAFARLARGITWGRLIGAALALAAASVTKFSWPLVLPALVAMALVVVFRRAPLETAISRRVAGKLITTGTPSRLERAGLIGGTVLFVGLIGWLGIWSCYGWRASIVAPLSANANTAASRACLERTNDKLNLQWQVALCTPTGEPRTGLLPAALRFVAGQGLVPDAYVLGVAQTLASTEARAAYLFGGYSNTGWWWYFPAAFALKTPLPTLALFVGGVIAVARRRQAIRCLVPLTGVLVFFATYWSSVMAGHFNIGQRHVLPVYPVVFVIAGAATAWWASRLGRVAIGAAFAWLIALNAWTWPQYLSYFNEAVGGPANGYKYLADSNVDWGQDLLRLRDYARAHPGELIKLAYFGSALPSRYVDCTSLPSFIDFGPRAELDAGTYVVSANQLLGLVDPEVRDTFWNDKNRQTYHELGLIAASIPVPDEPREQRERRAQAQDEFAELRYKRLLNQLRHRPPTERIGDSLFVYRQLSAADVAELVKP